MRKEYDFSKGKRGLFFRATDEKRYVVTLDRRPQPSRFEVYADESGDYRFRLKTADGNTVVSEGPFSSHREAMDAISELREAVLGADSVVSL